MPLLQSLKKFFIDDPIQRTKKIYFWCFNIVGMHISFLYTPYYYLYVRRFYRIGKDRRVGMMYVASVIIAGCNLRCHGCSVMSPHRKSRVSADELLASFTEWRKKIKPQYVHLTGGEPLLHPELERIIRESTKIWDDSHVWLFTNGLLLDTAKPEVLQAIKETGCKLVVSEHTFEPEHRKKLDAGYARLKEKNIPFVVRPSRRTWLAMHSHNEKGEIVPYQSDPKEAWNNCAFRAAVVVDGNQLYSCGHLYHIAQAASEGVLNADQWKAALTYSPLTLQASPEEIVEHLRCRAIPECAVCPGKRNIVPAQQIPRRNSE